MDGERKYKQHGYNESGRDHNFQGQNRDDRPRPQGPRPPIDVTGPRLPRLVQAVAASRCYNCASTLPPGVDFKGACPKCNAALHCCKQCAYFEPATRFQCLKPIPVRMAGKDLANECDQFKARVTVARDAPNAAPAPVAPTAGNGFGGNGQAPRNSEGARAAFDSLFKK